MNLGSSKRFKIRIERAVGLKNRKFFERSKIEIILCLDSIWLERPAGKLVVHDERLVDFEEIGVA